MPVHLPPVGPTLRAPAPPAQSLLGGGIGRGAKPPSEWLVCLAAEEGRDVEVFLVRCGIRVAPHLGDPAAPFPAGLGRAARPLRYLDDLGAGPGGLLALGEAGRDHRDAHLVLERGVD